MNDFYRCIVQYYDIIFPLSTRKLEFLWRTFGHRRTRLMDLGCGTGSYAIALAKMGYQVLGIDSELAMIRTARDKIRGTDLSVEFAVGDMRSLEEYGGGFEGIYCIGNTLAHVSRSELRGVLSGMVRSFTPNGRLITQIVNFDRLMERGTTELPLISDERTGLEFRRVYEPTGSGTISFKSTLRIDGKTLENEIELYPIHSRDLRRILEEVGFTNIRFYGDFMKHPFTEESQALVAAADLREG